MSKGHTQLNSDLGGLAALHRTFGARPGDYHVDPYWFRLNTLTGKPELWNAKTKKWQRITLSDRFDWDDEGNVVKL